MCNFNEKSVIERIKQLRLEQCGPRGKSNFAKALDISASTYSYYENDRLAPIAILLRICEITGANLYWLLLGQDDKKTDLSTTEKQILHRLSNLLEHCPESMDAILAFIDLLEQSHKISTRQDTVKLANKNEKPGWIPVLGRTAAGIVHFWKDTSLPEPQQAITELSELVEKYIGRPIKSSTLSDISIDFRSQPFAQDLKSASAELIQISEPDADGISEFVRSSQLYELFPDCFALRVDGDSMSPKIGDGDIVIISPSVPAAQGQIAIARVADQIGVTCKLIRTSKDTLHLIPINERYDTKIIPKEKLLWALAVLCHIRA